MALLMNPPEPKTKIVGKRRQFPRTPEECLRAAERLIAEMDKLNPYPRPRGFVFKAKTWEEYETWRKNHPNPRLW